MNEIKILVIPFTRRTI